MLVTSSSLSRSWKIPSSSSASTPLSSFSLVTVSLEVGSTTAATHEWEIFPSSWKKVIIFLIIVLATNFLFYIHTLDKYWSKVKNGIINTFFHGNMRNSLQHSQHLNIMHSESWNTILNQESKNSTKEEVHNITHLLHKKVKRKLQINCLLNKPLCAYSSMAYPSSRSSS